MTFCELFEEYIAEKERSVRPGTVSSICQHWLAAARYIGTMEVEEFCRPHARGLLRALLADGLSPATAKARMALVRQMLRYAAVNLRIAVDTREWDLHYPSQEPRRMKHYSRADVGRIVTQAQRLIATGKDSALATLIALMTGMRIGEVCGLRWEDVDYRTGVISVRRTVSTHYDPITHSCAISVGAPKTRAGYRDIPLVPVLRRALRLHGGRNPVPQHYVLTGTDTPAQPRAVRDKYDRLMARLGMPKINFHGLRHTYATRLVESGGDVKTISVILGHSDVSTTLNLYVHPSCDAKKLIAQKAFGNFDRKTLKEKKKPPK